VRAEEDVLVAELAAILRDVDARFAGWTCEASTTCCRFGVTGREPYVTELELLAVRRAIARSGRRLDLGDARGSRAAARGARSRGRRSLPVADTVDAARARDEGRCPLLGADGRCTIYASRPLGCRTFFCDRATPGDPVSQREINGFVARIRAVAVRHGPGADEGRPLVRALGAR
jgi:Fe-S-cluster containining protein